MSREARTGSDVSCDAGDPSRWIVRGQGGEQGAGRFITDPSVQLRRAVRAKVDSVSGVRIS